MTAEIVLISVIVIIIVFFGFGSLIWYAFRFEVTNFQIVNNIIHLKSKADTASSGYINNIKKSNISSSDMSRASLKILHLSDFHLRDDFKGQKLAGFIKILSLDSYDFIFITGDLAEKDEFHEKLIETLKLLKAKYGIYVVFGAHDYYNKKPAEFIKNMFKKRESYSRENDIAGLRRKLESIGIRVLQNESIILSDIAGYDEIDIVGVDDPIINRMDLRKSLSGIFQNDKDIKMVDISYENLPLKDLKKICNDKDNDFRDSNKSQDKQQDLRKTGSEVTLIQKLTSENEKPGNRESQYLINASEIKKTKEYREAFNLSSEKYQVLNNDKKLKIALVHTPDSYAIVNLALNGIDAVFAGHTHGGQVRVPGIGALISGCNIKTGYAAGLFYFKSFVLQVSKGLGEGRFSRFRIYCDPEAIITEIVFLSNECCQGDV